MSKNNCTNIWRKKKPVTSPTWTKPKALWSKNHILNVFIMRDMVKKALLLCSTRSYLVSIKDLRLHIIQKFGNCSKIKPNICVSCCKTMIKRFTFFEITWFTEEHEEELQLALNECSKGKWAKISRKGILSSENEKVIQYL